MKKDFLTIFENNWACSQLGLEQLDRSRRWMGKLLDKAGLGPIETPFRVVFTEPGTTLRFYGDDKTDGPVLLIFPAPIKRSYIWDLVPWASVVQQCVRKGLRVYLIHWEQPGEPEQNFGFSDYADRLVLDCLNAIQSETGQSQVFIAGHSLGGTLAALFAALYPERVKGLILIGAPLHFGQDTGVFGPLVKAASKTTTGRLTGNVPGSFLNSVCYIADPMTFEWLRWLDWIRSLSDLKKILTHLRVQRWTFDELPMAQHLFEEIVELLYREDRFMNGTLMVSGRRAAPEFVKASLLSIIDARCKIVPAQAVLPFYYAAGSDDKEVLWYKGDTGVALQHVGVLVGKNAHQHLWPKVIHWIRSHEKAAGF